MSGFDTDLVRSNSSKRDRRWPTPIAGTHWRSLSWYPRAGRVPLRTSPTPSGYAEMTIAEAIYLLCALTSLGAAFLLLRYFRRRRTRLLLWSAVSFAGLALNNVLVYVDLGLFPD